MSADGSSAPAHGQLGGARQELTPGVHTSGRFKPLLTIVDAIAALITVAVQQAPAILPARKLAFIVEARSFDGANRTVVIGDIRRKVIAVRECRPPGDPPT